MKKIINFAVEIKNTTKMARPIRETPILTGEDAERFVAEMQRVDEIPKEEREAKKRELQQQYAAIIKKITICL